MQWPLVHVGLNIPQFNSVQQHPRLRWPPLHFFHRISLFLVLLCVFVMISYHFSACVLRVSDVTVGQQLSSAMLSVSLSVCRSVCCLLCVVSTLCLTAIRQVCCLRDGVNVCVCLSVCVYVICQCLSPESDI